MGTEETRVSTNLRPLLVALLALSPNPSRSHPLGTLWYAGDADNQGGYLNTLGSECGEGVREHLRARRRRLAISQPEYSFQVSGLGPLLLPVNTGWT